MYSSIHFAQNLSHLLEKNTLLPMEDGVKAGMGCNWAHLLNSCNTCFRHCKIT